MTLSTTKNTTQSSFLVQLTELPRTLAAMEVGDKIRRARREKGWTQEQLAQAVGVNKSAVAQWETPGGARTGITVQNLQRVARVLGKRMSDLLEDSPPDEGMIITDPDEIALVELFRRMSARQKDVHLKLFYTSVGIDEGPQAQRNPSKRRRVVG
jgi:transcriptional regulator with XRE-family HTH domain